MPLISKLYSIKEMSLILYQNAIIKRDRYKYLLYILIYNCETPNNSTHSFSDLIKHYFGKQVGNTKA